VGGAVTAVGADLDEQGGSGSGLGINVFGSSETGKNLDAILNPAANLDRIKGKLDKNLGIDALEAIPAMFDLETQALNQRRNEILGRISGLDREASKSVAQARITERRRKGRSSTIL